MYLLVFGIKVFFVIRWSVFLWVTMAYVVWMVVFAWFFFRGNVISKLVSFLLVKTVLVNAMLSNWVCVVFSMVSVVKLVWMIVW